MSVDPKIVSILKKMVDLYNRKNILEKVSYIFEHSPSISYYNNETLEYIRTIYNFSRQDMGSQARDVEEVIFAKYVRGSNAIEGNTLSESEVYNLLFKGKHPYSKSHEELIQTRNHFDVKRFLDEYRGDINQDLIKEIHRRMLSGVDGYNGNDKPGLYRSNMVKIKNSNIMASKPENIEEDMMNMVQDYYERLDRNVHPIECIAVFHHTFEGIHPFRDGNGRTGRAVLDHMLRFNEYPPIYIPTNERENYFNALREGSYQSNYTPLIDFIIKRMFATFAYLFTKTPLINILKSDEFRTVVLLIANEEMHNELIDMMKYYEETDEDP